APVDLLVAERRRAQLHRLDLVGADEAAGGGIELEGDPAATDDCLVASARLGSIGDAAAAARPRRAVVEGRVGEVTVAEPDTGGQGRAGVGLATVAEVEVGGGLLVGVVDAVGGAAGKGVHRRRPGDLEDAGVEAVLPVV